MGSQRGGCPPGGMQRTRGWAPLSASLRSPAPSDVGHRGSIRARPVRLHRTGFDVSTQGTPRLGVKGASGAERSSGTLDSECVPVGSGSSRAYDGQVARPLEIPGHAITVKPTTSGRRWVTTCECGYVSATSAVESIALGKGIHHWNKIRQSQNGRQRMGIPSQQRRAV